MSMGSREGGEQPPLWVTTSELSRGEGHLFYRRLNELLGRHGFDPFVEKLVEERKIFAETLGRPSIPPGTYMRMMFVGFFEGLSSERAIAWKCADSLSLREFLGYGLTQATPDHSTLSGLRRKFPEEIHREIFDWVLKVAQEEGLLKGRKVAIDATTLEANAAMRTIVRRADGASYQKYLKKLAKAEGIKDPTPEDLGRMDRGGGDPPGRFGRHHHAVADADAGRGVGGQGEPGRRHPGGCGRSRIPQRRGGGGPASTGIQHLHPGTTAEEAPQLEETFSKSRRARSQTPTASVLPQSPQTQKRRRQTPSPQTWGDRREEFRSRLRDRGHATGSSARSSQHPQALPGPRRRPQPRHRPAKPDRSGHPARLPEQKSPPRPRPLVASLLGARPHSVPIRPTPLFQPRSSRYSASLLNSSTRSTVNQITDLSTGC